MLKKAVPFLLVITVFSIMIYSAYQTRIELTNNYNQAKEYMSKGNYESALPLLKTIGYGWRDSDELLEICENHVKYNKAVNLFTSAKYEEALELFDDFETNFLSSDIYISRCNVLTVEKHKEKVLRNAEFLYANGDYTAALKEYKLIPHYKNSDEMIEICYRKSQEN